MKEDNTYQTIDIVLEQPLTKEQLISLAKQKEAGSREARNTLILTHLPYAKKLAALYQTRTTYLTLDDLYQEAFIGLIHAVDQYDYRKGALLTTFSSLYIIKQLNLALAQDATIPLPQKLYRKLGKYKKAYIDYVKTHGTSPPDEAMSALLNIRPEQVRRLRQYIAGCVSLDSAVYDTSAGCAAQATLADTIRAGDVFDPIESTVIPQLFEINLRHLQPELTKREEDVFRKKLGMYPYREPKTDQELMSEYGLSKETIRKLYISALRKIRNAVDHLGYTAETFLRD